MNVVGKEIAFSYGHRLLEYEHQCRFLHGHNGKAVLVLRADGLGPAEIERMQHDVSAWIDANLDHTMLLNRRDDAVALLRQQGLRVFVVDGNPTAETIARTIHDYAASRGYPVVRVGFWESDRNYAEYAATASSASRT
jgi:6-pyruvoyltetrahydropterin/6-carboxytetrahydropterin synthase